MENTKKTAEFKNVEFDSLELIDKLPVAIFVLKCESREKKEFRNIFINKVNSEIVGTDLQPMVGKTLYETFPESYNHGLPDFYIKALETQKSVKIGEMKYGDEHIERQTFFLEVIPLSNDMVALITENISGLKKAQEELKLKNITLEQKNKELEQFVYIASHDLQEPLRTIVSYTQILNKKFSDHIDEGNRKMLNFITEAAMRMQKLIKGLLDFSRLGTNGKIVPINCNQLLNTVKDDLSSSINDSNAFLMIDKLPEIKGFEVELRLLFQNLILNAIKFHKHDQSPKIKISARKIEGFWEFSVTDNGIGINASFLSKIFLIFQRLHNRKDFEGTGIGLAHCKKIVEMHHGKIWVESTPDVGSTFLFTLIDWR